MTDTDYYVQIGYDRSGSIIIKNDGEIVKKRIKYNNAVSGKKVNFREMKSMFVLNFLSTEASKSFHSKFHKKMQNGIDFNSKSTGQVSTSQKEKLTRQVNYVDSSNEQFVEHVSKNRHPPHVIVIGESKKDNWPQALSFESPSQDGKSRINHYSLFEDSLKGVKCNGSSDAKQNMHFYIRENMKKTVEINKNFYAGKVTFQTCNDKEYSILTVHIPNAIAKGSIKEPQAHKLLKEYIKKDNTIIGYVGDTNYNKRLATHSSPSMGGVIKNKNTGANFYSYISPTSSSAKKHSFFMQALPLNENSDAKMLQPTMLNLSNLNSAIEKKTVGTDHPSIQLKIILTEKLKKATMTN